MDSTTSGHGPPHVPLSPTERERRFRALYERYFTLIWRTLRYFGVTDAERADLVQEVWLVVYRRLDSLQDDDHARSWIWSIVRRVVSQHRRTRRRADRRTRAVQDVWTDRAEPSVEHRVHARMTVADVVAALPTDQRDVLLLTCQEGLSAPEIADLLGVGLNTVYSRLRLARRRVDVAIANLGQPDEAPAELRQRCLAAVLGFGVEPFAASTPTPIRTGLVPRALPWMATAAGVAALAVLLPTVQPHAGMRHGAVDATAALERSVDEEAESSRARPARPLTPVTAAVSVEPARPSVDSLAPVRASAVAQSAEVTSEDDKSSSERRARRRERRRATASASGSEANTGDSEAKSRLALELALLTRASESVHTDPAAAIATLDEHRERFPDSDLWDIAESTRVRALCLLGRSEQAHRWADGLGGRKARSTAVRSALASCTVTDSDAFGHGPSHHEASEPRHAP